MALTDLTATMRVFVQWAVSKAITGLEDQTQEQDATVTNTFTFGTGSNQANQLYAAVRTLNANTAEDLDLYGGLTNPLGETINFATVKFMLFWLMGTGDTSPGDDSMTGTAASSITVGGDAAGAALFLGANTNTMTIKNGGMIAGSVPGTGFTVTNSTADVVQVMNNDLSVQARYLIVLGGTE